ncbi:hypothetical protein CLOP_g11024 [Closterium sp. NIES-67]|nr:hypothetical protein CLOP_g11024 [Closterium sp. NIES-67]
MVGRLTSLFPPFLPAACRSGALEQGRENGARAGDWRPPSLSFPPPFPAAASSAGESAVPIPPSPPHPPSLAVAASWCSIRLCGKCVARQSVLK